MVVGSSPVAVTDFDVKLKTLNKKVTSIKSKHLLAENELKETRKIDSSLFISQSYIFNTEALYYKEKN